MRRIIKISGGTNTTSSDRKSGSAGMPRPRSTLFPYTTLFRSALSELAKDLGKADIHKRYAPYAQNYKNLWWDKYNLFRSEERFSRNAETEIYTLSLHDALPICVERTGKRPRQSGYP